MLLHFCGAAFAQQKVTERQAPKDFTYPEASVTVEIEDAFSARSLAGTVEVPEGGGKLPDVLVERVNSDWDKRLEAVFTDPEGRFSFPKLPRGTYYLKLSKSGFSSMRIKVVLNKRSQARLKLDLPPGI